MRSPETSESGSSVTSAPRSAARGSEPSPPAAATKPSATCIHGLLVKRLTVIADERGRLFEMLRRDDPLFTAFGQVYCTTVNFGVVKGWHFHKKQVDNFVCVSGMIKLVAYDSRDGSPTKGQVNELFLGVHSPLLVQIPAGVYHGFKGISQPDAIVINIPNEPYHHHDPDEFRSDPHGKEIPYDWNRVDK